MSATEVRTPTGSTAGSPLWQPVRLAGRTVANRVAVAPMSRVSTTGDGVPTAAMTEYYRQFAAGGFATVITEGVYPAGPAAQAYADQPGLVTEAQVDGWRAVTDAVRAEGGLVIAQLMHAGALSQHLSSTLAPSAVAPRGSKMPAYGGSGPYPGPTAMTVEQVQEVVAGFAASAELAVAAGFDGVEVHAANGYLLDQFITPHTNDRTDRYGGSPAARTEVTREVAAAVRATTGAGTLVGVRLSQAKVNDSHHRWQDREEAEQILGTVAAAGPDYLHLAGEGRAWTESGRAADGTALGPLARQIGGVPVMVNGGLHDPELAERVLQTGHADMVSLGRGALADPAWPHAVAAGRVPRPFEARLISPSASLHNTRAAHASR